MLNFQPSPTAASRPEVVISSEAGSLLSVRARRHRGMRGISLAQVAEFRWARSFVCPRHAQKSWLRPGQSRERGPLRDWPPCRT